jgi:tRNA threonylcarbamoyl adenosine modification protein YjeE
MLELRLQSERATLALARSVADLLEAGDVVGLEGGLGAGKTTFARGAVHGLGVPEDTPVTSPTFALLHQYEGRLPIGHADLYRLASEMEIEELGLDELLEHGAVLFVEWGRKFPEMVRKTVLWVELDIVSDEERRVRLYPQGPRGDAIIAALSKGLSR